MPQRLLLILCALTMLSALPMAAPLAAQGGTPQLVSEITVPGAAKLKFPAVAVRDGTVHIGTTVNETSALYWNKPEAATSFGAPFTVGRADGQSDFSSVSLFIAPDGTLYYVWGSIEERRIKLRTRAPNGDWGPERTVAQSEPFPIFPRVAFAQGRIFVLWLDIGKVVYAKTSVDGGATFSARFDASVKKTFSAPPALAVGPNGEVAYAFTTLAFEIVAGFWNGSAFATAEQVTGQGFANPSLSYGPTGTLVAGYRGIDQDGSRSGAWISERQGPGIWAQQALAAGSVEGAVNVVIDKDNTRHFAWQSKISGTPQIYYAFQSAGQARSVAVGGQPGGVFNPSLAVGNTGTGLAHVVAERFDGDNSVMRYYLFAGRPTPQVDAVPTIAGGAEIAGRQAGVSVAFTGLVNNPTQIQWKWGAAPTDASNDSNGWQTFSATMTIPLPASLPGDCTPSVLYTRVRNAQATQTSARSDTIKIDGDINAVVSAGNPYSKRKAPDFSDAVLDDLASNGGASDGDAAYTRVPVFYLDLQNQADCSGLKEVATGQSATNIASPYTIKDGKFTNILPLPQLPTSDGPTSVVVRVSDLVGNTKDYTQQFTYDTTPPTLASTGQSVLSLSTTTSSLLVNLNFTGVQVSDNLYPAPGFWGIWVANSRTPVADPLNSATLEWVPVQTPGASAQFTVSNWSLAAGLPTSQVVPGDYYIYVRFLDGAGNPSGAFVGTQTTLPAITQPALYLPVLSR